MADDEIISTPSYNPSEIKTDAGVLGFIINKFLVKLEKAAPARVISYDRAANRAAVQILQYGITSDGEKIARQQISNIPVLMLSGGGFTFSFPIKEGDIGWIISADRDISTYKQNPGMFTPATYQIHKYKDGFFIPDMTNTGFTISEDDTDAVILTSTDGAVKVSVKSGAVTITAPSVIINGDTTINGAVTVSSTISAGGEVTGNGIALSTHTHGGVEAGAGSTGTPE